MNDNNDFYTLKGYQIIEESKFTPAMEDYLEMISRILQTHSCVRIRQLALKLNVQPPSASKMVQQLRDLGYINAEKYGDITLTQKGMAAGNYLLYRHNVIHNFLCYLNHSINEITETEKLEHFVSRKTVENIDVLMQKLINN